jgi:predicted RNA-binding protein associated with RNAse of E/G family
MFNFKPGKKYTISQEVKLSNNRNEIEFIKVYIDDTLVYTQNNINVTQELYLDKFIFSTFFGGSDISWASTRDTSINF